MKRLSAIYFIIILLSSCSTGKKFSYKDAYYFDYYTYQSKSELKNDEVHEIEEKPSLEEPVFSSSTDHKISKDVIRNKRINQRTDEKTKEMEIFEKENSKKKVFPIDIKKADKDLNKQMTRDEKRKLKKEIKKDIKAYKKKVKEIKKEAKTNQMTENIRLGLIIGGIGLIVAILGGASVLGTLGALAFIAGLVLIVIDLIKYY